MSATEERIRSRVALGACAGALVALVAAAPAPAQAPPSQGTVYLHSAPRGELDGGRLTLRGVARRLTWSHHSGRTGVMAVRRMHRTVFSGAAPDAIGTLHVAGHHGGDELSFRLSNPRYDRERRTVSYRAKPLDDNDLPRRRHGARAAQARSTFGAASLTIQAAPQPSLTVLQSTYPCPADGSTTCWGVLSGSGLPGGMDITGFAPQVPGNTGQGVEIDARTDAAGNISAQLNLLCTNDYHVVNPNISIDQTSVTDGFSVDSPGCS
jgi:hypothetical protein